MISDYDFKQKQQEEKFKREEESMEDTTTMEEKLEALEDLRDPDEMRENSQSGVNYI